MASRSATTTSSCCSTPVTTRSTSVSPTSSTHRSGTLRRYRRRAREHRTARPGETLPLEPKSLMVLREHHLPEPEVDHSVAASLTAQIQTIGIRRPARAGAQAGAVSEMRHPLSTYRLQIRESFTLDQAAEVTDYLRDLGVSWAYLSPILEATPGSDHGYDVVDVSRVDPARGGAEGLDRFVSAARAAELASWSTSCPITWASPSRAATRGGGTSCARAARRRTRRRSTSIGSSATARCGCRSSVRIRPMRSPRSRTTRRPRTTPPDGLIRYYEHAFPFAPGTGTDAAASGRGPRSSSCSTRRTSSCGSGRTRRRTSTTGGSSR